MNGANVSDIKSLEAVVIHLGFLTEAVRSMQTSLGLMATKEEIADLRRVVASLATKDQLDAEVRIIRDEVARNKPSTLARQVVTLCAGLAVVVAAIGAVIQVVRMMDRIVDRLPQTAAPAPAPAKPTP